MTKIIVNTEPSYPIYIEKSFENLPYAFKIAGLTGRKICIVTDSRVEGFYLSEVKEKLSSCGVVFDYTFPEGEESKNLQCIQDIYRFFMEIKMDRKSVVVALGGGVAGDMAGFAAATYMRGIPFVQLPTSLLSQVDSSVGGKVGVDFMQKKNLIGAFYQPILVYANINTLRTLPAEQFASGMGEVIKHGLIQDKLYYNFILNNKEEIARLEENHMERLLDGSCRIKASVVETDEKEQGLRAILNFGHTFGHAVETLSHFTLPHGACVAVGMSAALYLSEKRGNIIAEESEQARELFSFFHLPIKAPDYGCEAVFELMRADKKTKNDVIELILLNKIGEAYICGDASLEEIFDGIRSISLAGEEV